jgi:hypothetical protein
MAYTWIGSVVRGAKITNELVSEMRVHGDTIATWNLARNPSPAACTSYNKWVYPLASGADSYIATFSQIFDELQYNLNHWRVNNWCRGYAVTAHVTQHSSKQLSYNATQYSPACSQCVAQGSG